jgi:curved DNA-binding protein CbpA
MASTTAKRTHYDVLGLEPTATSDEVARAFAREMGAFRPHSISGLAEVTVAHDTLRDPARRREYDASIGLVRDKPKQLLAWSGVGHASFSVSAFASRPPAAEQPPALMVAVSPSEPEPAPEPPPPAQPEARAEPTPFIGAALRELARPEPWHEAARTQPEPLQQAAALDPPAAEAPDFRPALDAQLGDAEEASIPWKRTGIIAGALLAGVVLAGAWAGWNAGGGTENKAAITAALPPSTTFTVGDPAAAAAAPAPGPLVEEAQPVQPKRSALARSRVERNQPAPRLVGLERQIAELPQSEPSAAQAGEVAQVAEAAPAAAVAASMPLSNGVVARTLHRIGYPCGRVASTAPGDASGTFTVTCTSGHSYQAAPVHGRYRFRRMAGR